MGAKEEALQQRRAEDKVMYTENFSKYSFCASYEELMEIIKKRKVPRICEYVFEAFPVNFFYDIDIKETTNPTEFQNYKEIVHEIIDKTTSFFENRCLPVKVIVLKSPNKDQKKSFHMIFRADNHVFSIPCCISITNFIWKDSDYIKKGIIDKSVLREGNFRAYLCSKKDEVRPFLRCKSFGSQAFEDVETFVQHYSEDAVIWTEKDLSIPENHRKGVPVKKRTDPKQSPSLSESSESKSSSESVKFLQDFILQHFGVPPSAVSFEKQTDTSFTFRLFSKYCHFQKRDHSSNGQYITINPTFAAQMCHDPDCKGQKHNKILLKNYPDAIRRLFVAPPSNLAIANVKEIVLREYDDKTVSSISYNEPKNMFHGPADMMLVDRYFSGGCIGGCKIEHQVFSDGFHIKCSMCQKTFPNSGLITWKKEQYPSLHQHFNLTINNTIINNYNSAGEDEFGCEVKIDANIFNDQKFTDIVNQILDGHKICDLARLMKAKYNLFAYDRNMKEWYFFNGFRWTKDGGSLDFKEKIIDARSIFNDILLFYKDQPVTENLTHLRKNVRSLIKKMSDPGLKSLILEEARNCFREEDFCSKLNSKTSLVPFTNGVYDLLAGEFRVEVKKEDYVEFTVGYDYDPQVNNSAVHDFLANVLPDKSVRDYMLKMLAICLNGGISNEKFIFLLGIGSNGKSQLMNLMSQTMGQFNGKANGKMFTGKKPESDAPTPSLMGLKDKRFACASETEEGERINLALLKEITGDEYKVQGRNLNENITQFKMQAKFFLSTNNLPEIRGEGPSIWRRIRVVDFPTNFVDSPNPLKQNEKKKDAVIPSRIDNDLTWRQTFFNILLSYYEKDIPEPHAVLLRTKEYREESNEVEQWCKENIEFTSGGVLELTDLNVRRFGPDYQNRQAKGKFRKDVEKVLRTLGESVEGFEPVCKRSRLSGGGCSQSWSGIILRRQEFKTETKLYAWLNTKFSVEREKSFHWTLNEKSNHFRRYDFFLKDLNILIELDGKQHFEQVPHWGNVQEIKRIDEHKNELALNNNYHLIRICQGIVWNDTEDWEMKLLTAINELKLKSEMSKVLIGSIYSI